MADRYLTINADGITSEVESSATSSGAPDSGRIVALNSDGEIDYSMLPAGLGSEDINVNVAYALPIATKNKWVLTLLSDTDLTFDMTGVPDNVESASITVVIKQDSTGPFVPTFQTGVIWPNGIEPTWSTRSGAKDIVEAFTIDGGATWFATVTGVNYVGIVRGTVALIANATAQLVGGFLKKAADYESARVFVQAIPSVIKAFIVSNTVSVSQVSVSSVQYAGACALTNTAVLNVSGGINIPANAGLPSYAFITATGTSIASYVLGAASLSNTVITVAFGRRVVTGAVSMTSSATIAASGITAAFVVIFTDATNLTSDNVAPFGGDFNQEGMTLTVTGAAAPYDVELAVLRYRYATSGGGTWGSWQTSCAGIDKIRIEDFDYEPDANCAAEVVGPMSLTETEIRPIIITGRIYQFEVQVTITDAAADVEADTAIARYNVL